MNDYLIAILLGVVEGLTEFLPISSTGHMLLVVHALDIDLEAHPFWKLFVVVIQLGAIAAVLVYYASTIWDLLRTVPAKPAETSSLPADPHKQPPADLHKQPTPQKQSWQMWLRHPLVLVALAGVPAAVLGLALSDVIDQLMEWSLPIGLALIVGGAAMQWIEAATRGRATTVHLDQVTARQALGVGLAQCVALIPGVSRSGATIMGGLLMRMDTKTAADFSFLLGAPMLAGASAVQLMRYDGSLSGHQVGLLIAGFGVSFFVGLAVVAWFLRYIQTHSLRLFIYYRYVLGSVVIACWAAGWIR